MEIKGEIIAIGDEILIGQTLDTNSHYLSRELALLGISVHYITAIHDKKEALLNAFKTAEKRSDIVIITGGLGPTKDDITKHTLCEYFEGKLVTNQQRLKELADFFTKRGKPFNELNQTQALQPDVCTALHNAVGTANGMWFERNKKVFVSMPGVPYEMKYIFEHSVKEKIKDFFETPKIIHRIIRTIGIGESDLAIKIEEWENNLPGNFGLAYLPSMSAVKLRISVTVQDEKTIQDRLNQIVNDLYSLIGEYIYAEGDIEFETYIASLLTERNLSISTAESCTGGYLAHLLTRTPGSSAYYKGSVLAYSNEIKMQELNVSEDTLKEHGAVSEETVIQMAENIRRKFNTDIGIATSGIAGPGGGTENKPVGTVWIACSTEKGNSTKLYNFNRNRELNIKLTAQFALNLIRKHLE